MRLRVLFQTRPDYLNSLGGDTIQLLKTKEYIEKLGVKVEISVAPANIKDFDIVHLFNTTRIKETYEFFVNAKKQQKPVAVSTIYWDFREFCTNQDSPANLYKNWLGSQAMRRPVFRGAAMLLPNSRLEADMIRRQHGHTAPMHIVPNGVDPIFARGNPDAFYRQHGLKNYILCVGRINTRKNQLALARALKGSGLTLILAGPLNDREYLRKCQREYPGLIALNHLEHHELPGLYSAAKIHVLPSWFETPGLASLEAGLSGCNIVTTDRGSTKEYFGDLACYCDPGSIDSIRKAIVKASSLPEQTRQALKKHIAEKFLWTTVARETLAAYEKILSFPTI
jgi:glycosyltransferase involved in cell wall biosynthesis